MRIDEQTIERIRQSADIADVIGDYVSLKKKGANLWACCPFHGEKSPSFSVSPAKGIYKCFGCGKAGDSIRFIMDIEGLGYGEALRHLAKKYGIEIQESVLTDEQMLAQNERESLLIVLNYAKNYFQNNLFKHEEGQSIGYPYFKERGFSDKTINTFELGYSLEGWDAFTKEALKNGYSLDILAKAGLTILKENEQTANPNAQKSFDRFRNRVTFPIHNVAGKVIAFGARILKADKSQAKYLNSPETEVYHKSNVLYGIFQAKNAIRTQDVCYLVEGYTDVISLHQAGIENVVASSGTSLTTEQIRLIGRFTQNITVLYDGDSAGIKASLRGMDMILEEGLNVKLVVFPEGEDPDSYVQKIGSDAFVKHIEDHAADFITFKAELSLKEAGSDPFKRAELIKDMVGSISKIPDSIKRSVFFQKTANLMQIDEQLLISESNKVSIERAKQKDKDREREQNRQRLQNDLPKGVTVSKPTPPPPAFDLDGMMSFSEEEEFSGFPVDFVPAQPVNNPVIDSPEAPRTVVSGMGIQELECIRLLINHGTKEVDPGVAPGVTLMQYILSEIDGMNFETPIYQEILTIFREQFLQGNILNAQHFIGHRLANIQMEAINLSTERYSISEAWVKHDIHVPTEEDKLADLAFQNILRLKKAYNEQQMKGLMKQMSQTKDLTEQTRLLEMFMEAKEIEKQIAKELGSVVK
ncbi:DNA primase [Arcicella aurantiaca]|uniref:DNA primase n=1 Tax=Arcicella aurantiaca TaxID=591202 RepID=A0A316EBI1_9BACT|nr:DNA primase [Arcicella aurantiaca]PWK26133.1 DNA primase [Arcicella aurantiaca]